MYALYPNGAHNINVVKLLATSKATQYFIAITLVQNHMNMPTQIMHQSTRNTNHAVFSPQ